MKVDLNDSYSEEIVGLNKFDRVSEQHRCLLDAEDGAKELKH